jgi:F420-dependent oxidoreductase-like protein
MRIGIFGGFEASQGTVDDVLKAAAAAREQRFASYWLPHIFGFDAITLAGMVGCLVPEIEVGTAVVPTFPRHPIALAQQALTANALAGGRFTLGIGLSHQVVIETIHGLSFDKPVRHMREYLSILGPLVRGESVSFKGETMAAAIGLGVHGAPPCPILVAALGPQMLALTARMADGTITWMTGASTLADHTVPVITEAAEAAGRGPMRVVAGVPVCVTDDATGARERAARVLQVYGTLPSYRAMLDREGLAGPEDMVIAGGEDEVRAAIGRYDQAGVTDFMAVELGGDDTERTRTRQLLKDLL